MAVDISKVCTIALESGRNDHACRESNWCGCECHVPLPLSDIENYRAEQYLAEQQSEEQYRSWILYPEYWEARTGRTNLW